MNVIDEAIVEEVRRRLDQVEASEGVRILLAVESYLSMTRERPYGGMLSDTESLERVRLQAGRIYDPAVIAALAAEVDPGAAAA